MAKAAAPQRWYGTGRRKEATARVWISSGEGAITVNRRPIDTYFARETLKMILQQPLDITSSAARSTSASTCAAAVSPVRPAPSVMASPARSWS
jgi:ribosomal protein S9